MDWEKKGGIPTTWEKTFWEILASRNPIPNGSIYGPIGKIGIFDYSDFVVSSIVREHDGRAYLVESDCRICMDDDGSGRKKISSAFHPNGGLV